MRFGDMDGLNKSAEEFAAVLLDAEAVKQNLHAQAKSIAAKCVGKDLVGPLADQITVLAFKAFGMGKTARELESITQTAEGKESE